MKGDYSKDTFDASQHFSSVRLQQGRVLMDADWNEQVDIERGRYELALRDVVGPSGVPEGSDGFALSTVRLPNGGTDALIKPGRMYVDGLLCVCEESAPSQSPVSFTKQPHHEPDQGGIGLDPLQPRLLYLTAFTRHITVAEEPRLGDPAVGATATRTQTVWQVRADNTQGGTRTSILERLMRRPVRTGRLRAASPPAATLPTENGLYRVEVWRLEGSFQPDGTFAARRVHCKWSRDNGSFATAALSISGDKLAVVDSSGFRPGGALEILSERDELRMEGTTSGLLFKCLDVKPGQLTVETATPFPPTVVNPAERIRIYAWDGSFDFDPATGGTFDLGGVARVTLAAGVYQLGDYWQITVRANSGILSPQPNTDVPARFIDRKIAPLAEVHSDGRVTDLRPRFRSLSGASLDKRLRLLRDRQDSQVTLTHVIVIERKHGPNSDYVLPDIADLTRAPNGLVLKTPFNYGATFETIPQVYTVFMDGGYRPSPPFAVPPGVPAAKSTRICLSTENVQPSSITLRADLNISYADWFTFLIRVQGRMRPMTSIGVVRDDATGNLHLFTTRYNDVRYRCFDAAQQRWQGWQNMGWGNIGGAIWSRPYPMMFDGRPIVMFEDSRRMLVWFARPGLTPDDPWRWDAADANSPPGFAEASQSALPRNQRPLFPISTPPEAVTRSRIAGVIVPNGGRLVGLLFRDRNGTNFDMSNINGLPRRHFVGTRAADPHQGYWTVLNQNFTNITAYDPTGTIPGVETVAAQLGVRAVDEPDAIERQYRDINVEAPLHSIWVSPISGCVLLARAHQGRSDDNVGIFASMDGTAGVSTFTHTLARGTAINGVPTDDTVSLWVSPAAYAPRGAERVAYFFAGTGTEASVSRGRQARRLWSVVVIEGPPAGNGVSTLRLERTLAFGPGATALFSGLTSAPTPIATGVATNNPGDIHAVAFALGDDPAGRPGALYEFTLSNGTWSYVQWTNVLPPGVSIASAPAPVKLPSGKIGCFVVGSDGHIYELGRRADGSIYVTDHDLPLPDDGIG